MVNETLEDIFNEFYSRQNPENNRIKELEDELDDCWAKIGALEDENNSLEDEVYDRNREIEDLEFEIRRLNSELQKYQNALEKACPSKS